MISGMMALALAVTPAPAPDINFGEDGIARVTSRGTMTELPYMMTPSRVCLELNGRNECWRYGSDESDGQPRNLVSSDGVQANIAFGRVSTAVQTTAVAALSQAEMID